MKSNPSEGQPSFLLLTGTVGSGKTTTAFAVGEELQRLNVSHAVVDLDEVRRAWPAPADDRFHARLGLSNLAAVTSNYLQAGATRLVGAGVIEGVADRAAVAEAVGVPLIVCRLKVDLVRVHERLLSRHEDGPTRDWHLHRSGELDRILDQNDAADFTLVVGRESADEVAREVLRRVGWGAASSL